MTQLIPKISFIIKITNWLCELTGFCHLNFPVPPTRVHVRCAGRCHSALSRVERGRSACSSEADPAAGELLAVRRAHGTATASSSLPCKGVEEKLAGVLRLEIPRTVQRKLLAVPGRERRYSLMTSAIPNLCFSCH